MWDTNSFIQGTLTNRWSKKFRTLFNTKYAADYTHYENQDAKLIQTKNTYKQKEFYFSCANLYNIFEHWEVSLAYDFQWNTLDATFYSVEYSNQTSKNTVTYAIIDVKKKRVVSRKFITDGTELDIVIPYGIAIHPRNGDIYVTDAKNYVSSGVLHCYSREGVHKWSVRTGDIPAHMVFLERKQTRQ